MSEIIALNSLDHFRKNSSSLDAPLIALSAHYLSNIFNLQKNRSSRVFDVASHDEGLVRRVHGLITSVTGKEPKFKPDPIRGFRVQGGATELGKVLDKITRKGTRIPFEMLDTPEKRILFLKEFLMGRGSVKKSDNRQAFNLEWKGKRNVLDQLVLLFPEHGVFPNINDKFNDVYINDQRELLALLEKEIISQPKAANLAFKETTQQEHSPAEYEYAINQMNKTETGLSIPKTADLTPSQKSWTDTSSVPFSVIRYAKLWKLAEKYKVKHLLPVLPNSLAHGTNLLEKRTTTVTEKAIDNPSARIYALFLTKTISSNDQRRLTAKSSDEDLVKHAARLVGQKLGLKIEVTKAKDETFCFSVKCPDFVKELNAATNNQTTVPFKKLTSFNKRKAFLQTMLTTRGNSSLDGKELPSFRMNAYTNPHVMDQLLPLFAEHDVFPNVYGANHRAIKIVDLEDISNLLQAGLLPASHKNFLDAALESDRTRNRKLQFRLKDFEKTQEMLKKGARLRQFPMDESVRKGEYVIPSRQAVMGWMLQSAPLVVRRYAKAYLAAQKYGVTFKVKYPHALTEGLRIIQNTRDETSHVVDDLGFEGEKLVPVFTPDYTESLGLKESISTALSSLSNREKSAVKNYLKGRGYVKGHLASAFKKLKKTPHLKQFLK